MSGRPRQKQANIESLQKIYVVDSMIDTRKIITYVMRHSGCTYTEIGKVLGISRQMAEQKFKQAENTKLENVIK